MDWRKFIIEPDQLAIPGGFEHGPLVIVDCDSRLKTGGGFTLPACPVIGLGSRESPVAGWCDAMIEPPFSVEQIATQISRKPLAAAALVHLLRLLPGLSPTDGLSAESMAYGMLQGGAEHARWLAGRGAVRLVDVPGDGIEMVRNGACLQVILDGSRPGNAIDRAMRDGLHQALVLGAADSEITRIVLEARGRSFCMGANLDEFGTTRDPALAHAIRWQTLPARAAALCADRLEAHVQGACVGAGLELAAWAQRVTARAGAWFQLPELAMGLLPGAGGSVSLTRRIGRQRTALMILSGRRISARTALDWGLVDAIVDQFPA